MKPTHLLERFLEFGTQKAVVWNDHSYSYLEIHDLVVECNQVLMSHSIKPGEVVTVIGDYSPKTIAVLLALMCRGCIVAPICRDIPNSETLISASHSHWVLNLSTMDSISVKNTKSTSSHPLLEKLADEQSPGLIVFSSSGHSPKGIVHNFNLLLEKYRKQRSPRIMIGFLRFDHLGGLNTLFYTLSHGGCLVTVKDRNPETVCEAIERYRAQVLPATPTFLNLLLISEAYRRFSLDSLTLITYGTEAMSKSVLERLHREFGKVDLLQTYGLSELGALSSRSKSPDSLWVRLGGDGFQTRVVGGRLEIKARSSMLGYLNAPDPFTDDGWFRTGDHVQERGDYVQFLGKDSEMINVGGLKVHPNEVENIIIKMELVEEVLVERESNPITGQMVSARIKLRLSVDSRTFRKKIRQHCRDHLEEYKIPQRICFTQEPLHSHRFKKIRNHDSESARRETSQ